MAEAEGVRLTEHQRSWLERIRACDASGMTMAAYAAEHGLDARTMYGARKVLKRKGLLPGGDHAVRSEPAGHEVEPQARRSLADHDDVLADEAGERPAGVDDGA